jgi:hypothetical protein
VNDTAGSLTVEGEFYGPVRVDKAVMGVRMAVKDGSDALALAGHMETGSGIWTLWMRRGT